MSLVFCDPATAAYHTPGHPESPQRVLHSRERLQSAGHSVLLPDLSASSADVLLVHHEAHLDAVRRGRYQDADTPHYPNIESLAFISLSGALSAGKSASTGVPAFSLMRPPGHHAGRRRVAGFCYFNNLSIAGARWQKENPGKRLALLDIDVHHGDGTQDIMLARDNVLYASLHQAPLYPGTGLQSVNNCLNFPLAPGTGEGVYLKTLESALTQLLDFKPDLLAVSAGFDTYKECPIAGLKLDKPSYRHIGKMLSDTGLKRFAVLEGGYAEELPVLIENFLDGFFA